MANGTHEHWDKRRPRDIYIRVCAGSNRGQYVHRLVAAAMISRPLRDDEAVHHKDGDTTNNDFKNLEILSWEEHGKITRAKFKPKIRRVK